MRGVSAAGRLLSTVIVMPLPRSHSRTDAQRIGSSRSQRVIASDSIRARAAVSPYRADDELFEVGRAGFEFAEQALGRLVHRPQPSPSIPSIVTSRVYDCCTSRQALMPSCSGASNQQYEVSKQLSFCAVLQDRCVVPRGSGDLLANRLRYKVHRQQKSDLGIRLRLGRPERLQRVSRSTRWRLDHSPGTHRR